MKDVFLGLFDRVCPNGVFFPPSQGILQPAAFSEFASERNICISMAASLRDVCKGNPDRGVDLILSVSVRIVQKIDFFVLISCFCYF